MNTWFARIMKTLRLRPQDRMEVCDIPSFLYKHGERPATLLGESVTDPAQHPTHFLLTDGEMLVWPNGRITRVRFSDDDH